MATKNKKKRTVKVDSTGIAHISSTFNNIIISMTNNSGEVISWSSAGKQGFRGSKKTLLMQGKLQLKIVLKLLLTRGYVR